MNVLNLSATIPFTLTAVQVPNVELSHKKRIIVYKEQSLHEKILHDPNHKVLIRTYIEHHSVCPLVGIGTPPNPLPQASVPSPLGPTGGGWGHTRLRVKGWGSPNSNDWRKSLAL
jgi:hypothetical protein